MRYYKLQNNKAYPSVTTILGTTKPEGYGLRTWKAKNHNWRDILTYTALRGTMIHNNCANKCEALGARSNAELEVISATRIMGACKKLGKPITDFFADIAMGANFFDKFLEEHKVVPLMSEAVVYSDRYKFAGQIDQVMWLDDELTLLDIKTSKAVYKDSGYDMQLSAYGLALAERTGNKKYEDCRKTVLLLSPDIEATERLTYKLVDLPDASMAFINKCETFHINDMAKNKHINYRDFSKQKMEYI